MSAFAPILLQNDFERPATKFLIQGFNGQRKIDSSGGLLGFDCCVLDACRRLLQHNRANSGRSAEALIASSGHGGLPPNLGSHKSPLERLCWSLDQANAEDKHTYGQKRRADISKIDRLLSEKVPFASMVLETDAYVAWLGAHQGGDGAIVILGTGSCGLALINGRRIGVAGWGAEVSDEAGGQRLGREALRRTLWAFDGRAEKTALSTAILDRFGWDPARIVRLHQERRLLFMLLAPLVLQETAEAAVAIVDRLANAGASAISLVSGLAEPLLPWLPPRIRDLVTAPQSDALDGSILMARRAFFKLDSVRLRAG